MMVYFLIGALAGFIFGFAAAVWVVAGWRCQVKRTPA